MMVNEIKKRKIVVFTGAGISAESGLSTFRDSDGLWENYSVHEIATKDAFEHNPELVLSFYNQRKIAAAKALPNKAHIALAELEAVYDVIIITQNVDDLHEKAGSSKVIHLHGQLSRAQSSLDSTITYDWDKPIYIGQHCELNSQLRPNVVWFGEPVMQLEEARNYIKSADKVLAIGSSLTVQPAAGLLKKAPYKAEKKLVSLCIKGECHLVTSSSEVRQQASFLLYVRIGKRYKSTVTETGGEVEMNRAVYFLHYYVFSCDSLYV